MLIGIDASRANRKHKSGTEWYSYYLIKWLAKIDSENQYILYSDKPLKGCMADLGCNKFTDECGKEIKFDKDGYQILKSSHNNFRGKILKWPFNFLWTQGRLSLDMLCCRPDVLFIPAHTLPIIHPRKSIVTLHDVGFKRNSRLYEHGRIGPKSEEGRKLISIFAGLITLKKFKVDSFDYLAWSTAYALKKAKKIITVSLFSKEEMVEIYGAEPGLAGLAGKIKVVHNGYNGRLYKKVDDKNKAREILDKYGINGPYILYVGRIDKKKNIPSLIEAFSIMREKNKNIKHKLVLAGDASFGYDEVNYMIREFGLENDVVMPGWVEEVDMPYFYTRASVFVFPSHYEGFGIPLLQAMACETPIAASRAASIPEVAGDAALLFDPNDITSIAQAMERVIVDDELREKLIERGKKRVKNFSLEKCARETLKEINALRD